MCGRSRGTKEERNVNLPRRVPPGCCCGPAMSQDLLEYLPNLLTLVLRRTNQGLCEMEFHTQVLKIARWDKYRLVLIDENKMWMLK